MVSVMSDRLPHRTVSVAEDFSNKSTVFVCVFVDELELKLILVFQWGIKEWKQSVYEKSQPLRLRQCKARVSLYSVMWNIQQISPVTVNFHLNSSFFNCKLKVILLIQPSALSLNLQLRKVATKSLWSHLLLHWTQPQSYP